MELLNGYYLYQEWDNALGTVSPYQIKECKYVPIPTKDYEGVKENTFLTFDIEDGVCRYPDRRTLGVDLFSSKEGAENHIPVQLAKDEEYTKLEKEREKAAVGLGEALKQVFKDKGIYLSVSSHFTIPLSEATEKDLAADWQVWGNEISVIEKVEGDIFNEEV